MTSYTPNLKLLKKDPSTDGNDTFNIETMLNENWDKVDEEVGKKADRKTHIVYIEESQNWVVPGDVTQVDVFIVDGGYDGKTPTPRTPSTSGSGGGTFGKGGDGGNGGACLYLPNVKVIPNQTIDVIVGASNGGISSFSGITANNQVVGATGGIGVSSKRCSDDNNGGLVSINNLYDGAYCPIDGKYYGVSGAGGYSCAAYYGSSLDSYTIDNDCKGGLAGKEQTNHISQHPQESTCSSSYAWWCGGGGASYDNNGGDGYTTATSRTALGEGAGGNGGDATTYGCGGGGGGNAPDRTNYTAGIGGAGAQGVVIIAY